MRPSLLAVLCLVALPALAGVYTWVDENGVTHIVDDPAAVPEEAREGRGALRELWGDGVLGPGEVAGPPAAAPRGLEDERLARLVSGAVADLERGETARASVALQSVLRSDPGRPEAHWYLALLDRERGRYESAEAHLRAFLAASGDDHEAWRRAAQSKLAALDDERRLADSASLPDEDAWVGFDHPHFHVLYDAELARASGAYAATVVRYLEEAHAVVGARLGALPREPMGVRLYGKAAYLRAHRHRFSFQTVGFFDGRIHVVSAAHPAGELRALLFHEYTHAVFREQTGGDRPFWLNEGLAELNERQSRQRPGLTRTDRALLRRRIDAGSWISLRRLAPSFAGLDDGDASAAYETATAAALWIESRTSGEERGFMLARLGLGAEDDEVFREVLGLDTAGIDAAVQRWIREEFPVQRPAGL